MRRLFAPMRAESAVLLGGGAVGAATAAGVAVVGKPLAVAALASATATGSAILGKPLGGAALAGLNAAAAASVAKLLAGAAQGAGAASGVMPSSNYPALGALAFYANSGADDYAQLLSLPSTFGVGEFTFEFRCKLDETYPVGTAGGSSTTNWSSADPTRYSNSSWWYPGNFLIDGHNNSTIAQGTFSVQVIGGGRLRWDFGDNSGSIPTGGLWAVQPVPASSAPSLLDDKWHHVALVRRWSGASSATLEMWIDGALIASETTNVRTNMQTYWATWGGYGGGIQNGWLLGAEKFSAGGGTYWDDYKGLVSYLRFYDRAKTATELANDWARDSTQGESGLVGLFQMGALAANRTYDTLRPAAYIQCVPQAGAARVTEIPIAAVVPTITFTQGVAGSVDLVTGARSGTVSPAAGAYIAGFDAAQHAVQRVAGSPALPAGVSLSSTGVLDYDGVGAVATVSGAQIEVVPSSEADWAARSGAEGVLWATRFDTDAEVLGDETVNFANSSVFYNNRIYNPNLSYAGPGNRNPRIYRAVGQGIGGAHCMRQEHYASDGQQMGGWRRMFVPGQANWPLNTPLYVAFAVRFPASKFALGSTGNNEWKVAILAGWGNSGWGNTNQDRELTLQNTGDYRVIRHYTQGSPGLEQANFPNAGNFRLQNQIDRGPGFTIAQGRYCSYQQGYPTPPCIELDRSPSLWLQMLYRLNFPTASTVDIDIWCAWQPETVWTHLESWANYNVWGTDPFNTLTFLSYTTSRGASAAQNTYQDITEVIVSTQPIVCRSVWPS